MVVLFISFSVKLSVGPPCSHLSRSIHDGEEGNGGGCVVAAAVDGSISRGVRIVGCEVVIPDM